MTTQTDPRTTVLAILGEEASIYERLHAVARDQRTALLENDADTLLMLVREMAAMTSRVERLEGERLAAVACLTGDPDAAAPISTLLSWFDEDTGAELSALRDHLLASLQRVRVVNAENALLARRLVSVSDQSLRLLASSEPPVYTAAGAHLRPGPRHDPQPTRPRPRG